MKIYTCPYELSALTRGQQPRHGVLLKVAFADGITGFCDLHPWPELGDPVVEDVLNHLKEAPKEGLAGRALHMARVDGEARFDEVSLFAGLEIPRSHFLIPDLLNFPVAGVDQLMADGYQYAKVKMGRDLEAETAKLKEICLATNDRLQLRIDFNQRLSEPEFSRWAKANEWLHEVVDYIEDPFAYSPAAWKLSYGFAFALDRAADPFAVHAEAVDVLVVKPELHDPMALREALKEEQLRFVLTNNLGHPLGHAASLWQAAQFYQHHPELVEVCGLQGLQHYAHNDWTSEIEYRGPVTVPPEGTGFGFDRQLESISWKHL